MRLGAGAGTVTAHGEGARERIEAHVDRSGRRAVLRSGRSGQPQDGQRRAAQHPSSETATPPHEDLPSRRLV